LETVIVGTRPPGPTDDPELEDEMAVKKAAPKKVPPKKAAPAKASAKKVAPPAKPSGTTGDGSRAGRIAASDPAVPAASDQVESATLIDHVGSGGETHQTADGDRSRLTTQQGVPVADDQNTLRAGERGPSLLSDFHFREKIFHFDHERIPERVVHARGFGVHGYFEPYESLADITRADLFQRPGERTPVFVRFSTPSPATRDPSTWPATSAASPSSSTRRRGTGIWSATTSPCSSSRTPSSSPTSSTP
jgi:catalase